MSRYVEKRIECRSVDCERRSLHGWTTCRRHYDAGMSLASWRRLIQGLTS